MSGSAGPVDFTPIVVQQQNTNQLLASIRQVLAGGVVVIPAPPSYTVATLPTTASGGTYAWTSNGRKPGEGAGTGTGVPVFFNSATAQWFSFLSGAAVAA